jgi:hypothetical protein
MISILIAGNNIQDNERIAGSLIGGTELTTCIVCTRSASEALEIAESRHDRFDLLSTALHEGTSDTGCGKNPQITEYRDCPILFCNESQLQPDRISELLLIKATENSFTYPPRREDRRAGKARPVSEEHSEQSDRPDRARDLPVPNERRSNYRR